MDRVQIYARLSSVLDEQCRLPFAELVKRVGADPARLELSTEAGPVTIEVTVSWQDEASGTLRITGTADGPSCWRLERMEESTTVAAPA